MRNPLNWFSFKKNSWLSYLLGPVLSGVFIGTSYIPFPPWCVVGCYVPLWLFALKQDKLKPLLIGGWICQCVVTLIGFNWVAFAIQEMEFPFWPHTFFLFLFFTSIANLHIPLSLFLFFVSRKILSSEWKIPIFRTNTPALHSRAKIGEISNQSSVKKHSSSVLISLLLPIYLALCTEYYPMMIEWHLGYTLFYANWPISQTAEIWGFKFLNTLILLSNHFFLHIELLREQKKTNPVKENIKTVMKRLFFLLLCFFGLSFYGMYLEDRVPEPDQKIRVLMIQPNIENKMQEDEKYNDFILSKILQETSKHFPDFELSNVQDKTPGAKKNPPSTYLKQIDFILWPEGAYPWTIDLSKAKKMQDPAQKLVNMFKTPLIISARGINTLKKRGGEYTNSVFVFLENGQLAEAPYNKTKLLPFGEYTPGGNLFPFIDKWLFGNSRAYSPGTGENKLVYLNKWNLGFQICYEALFDWFSRETVREGADILINVSNDAWFGNWQEPYQHLYMTLSRAIEVRRPLIRGTNSGFSAVISARGNIYLTPMILDKNLSYVTELSVYSQDNKPSAVFCAWGYYINELFLWTFLILIHLLNYSLGKNQSALKHGF